MPPPRRPTWDSTDVDGSVPSGRSAQEKRVGEGLRGTRASSKTSTVRRGGSKTLDLPAWDATGVDGEKPASTFPEQGEHVCVAHDDDGRISVAAANKVVASEEVKPQSRLRALQEEIAQLKSENEKLKSERTELFEFFARECSLECPDERRIYMLKAQILALEQKAASGNPSQSRQSSSGSEGVEIDLSTISKQEVWDLEGELRELLRALEPLVAEQVRERQLQARKRVSATAKNDPSTLQRSVVKLLALADRLFFTGLRHSGVSTQVHPRALEREIIRKVERIELPPGVLRPGDLQVPESLSRAWHELLTGKVEKRETKQLLGHAVAEMIALGACWKKWVFRVD